MKAIFDSHWHSFSIDCKWLAACSFSSTARKTMSCRIDRVVSDTNSVVLLVSGGITGEHVDILRGVLEQEPGGFAIDLHNVVLVDREAVKLLALTEANGTELRSCPAYIRVWVTRERAEMHGRRTEPGLERREDIGDA